jgi:hypothetical protein
MGKKLKLKGSMYGNKKLKLYDDPDIISSNVDKHICHKNSFDISYDSNKRQYYVYHSYDGVNKKMEINYSGRWYLTDFIFSDKSLNKKKNSFQIILKNINWENFNTGKTTKKDVKIQINFSEKGFDKLENFFLTNGK